MWIDSCGRSYAKLNDIRDKIVSHGQRLKQNETIQSQQLLTGRNYERMSDI